MVFLRHTLLLLTHIADYALKNIQIATSTYMVQFCGMATKESIQQKKEYAKLLYTVEGVTVQKDLAERVKVSKQTINKWVNEEKWESTRASVIITKEQELKRLYMQLTELNDFIFKKPEGERFANSKESDTLVKLTAAVRQLETETSQAQSMEVLGKFINFIRQDDFNKAKEITNLADLFIKNIAR